HVAEAYWNDTLQREGCRLVPYLYDHVNNDTLNLATTGPGDLVTTHCHYLEGLPLLEYRDLKAATATTPACIDFHELTAWATGLDSYGFLLVYPSGITEYQGFLNLRVHPNPFTDKLIVEIEPNKRIARLELWNRQGALVMLLESNDNKLAINTSQLPAGIYTLRVYAGLSYQTYKVMKL
ncbi:MAG TPA: T9SS type A sorting domain-containing protein, partial [Bacteroidales bacterium]|nr:T9SS type A sorting domain-containing protein [Bacteroidales bacterium]